MLLVSLTYTYFFFNPMIDQSAPEIQSGTSRIEGERVTIRPLSRWLITMSGYIFHQNAMIQKPIDLVQK